MIRLVIFISYSTPRSQLPKNQKTPKDISKIPYPVALLDLGTTEVTAAFRMDSYAPIPTPQRIIPSKTI